MRTLVLTTGGIVACLLLTGAPAQAQRRPAPPGWTLVWQDEFTGTTIDTTRWGFDLGRGFSTDGGKTILEGWGNNELQCYTRAPENAAVRDGMLHVRALRSDAAGCAYTSARLKTRGADGSALFAQRYGRFEFRAKLPVGRGLWPALWMLPQDEAYGTWAASGEINIMEARGQTPSTVLGTLHYGGRWPANTFTGADYVLPRGGSIADFHVYAVEWDPGRIRWLVDGVVTQTQTFWWSSSLTDGAQGVKPTQASQLRPWPAPFDQRFYLLINLAVGGNFLGSPDESTKFPGELIVDFVRVYSRRGGDGPLHRRGPGALPTVGQ